MRNFEAGLKTRGHAGLLVVAIVACLAGPVSAQDAPAPAVRLTLDEAERCARVALLHEGRTLAIDEPSRLRTLIGGRILEVMAPGRPDAADAARALPGVSDVQVFGERLHLTVEPDSDEAVDAVVREIARTSLAGASVRAVPPSLEDVFIATLSRKEQAGA